MRRSFHRRGFAMLVAIWMLALVAMMLAALALACHADARRTEMAEADAQLRQLLTAGTAAMPSSLQTTSGNSIAVALPKSLNDEEAILTVFVDHLSASDADVRLEAALPGRRMSQRAHFSRDQSGWRLTTAELSDF
jgi:hypothetical protein